MDETLITAFLTSEKDALPMQAARANVDASPGLYSIFVDDANSLPDPFRTLLVSRGTRLLYVGCTEGSLYKRLIDEELMHKKAATFFRGIGAVLGYLPVPGSLRLHKKKNNYKFSSADTAKVISWNERHLRVRWLAMDVEQILRVEPIAIRVLCPLFNTKHNPHPSSELAVLRAECRKVAGL